MAGVDPTNPTQLQQSAVGASGGNPTQQKLLPPWVFFSSPQGASIVSFRGQKFLDICEAAVVCAGSAHESRRPPILQVYAAPSERMVALFLRKSINAGR